MHSWEECEWYSCPSRLFCFTLTESHFGIVGTCLLLVSVSVSMSTEIAIFSSFVYCLRKNGYFCKVIDNINRENTMMKKIFTVFAVAMALASYAPEAQAQGLLGKLKDKAVEKVAQSVEAKVGQAVIGGMKKTPVATPAKDGLAVKGVGDELDALDHIQEFVGALTATKSPLNEDGTFTKVRFSIPEDTVYKPFKDIQEAVKSYPGMPTLKQVVDQDETFAKAYVVCTARTSETIKSMIVSSGEIVTKGHSALAAKGNPVISDKQKTDMNAMAAQMFQLMQKHGIDPETATDEQMEAFAKKMVLSGELKVPNMPAGAALMGMDETDEQEEATDKIYNKLDELNKKVQEASAEIVEHTSFGAVVFPQLYEELQASWMGSEACKKVYDIEKDIDARLNEYFDNLQASNGEVVEYPKFWQDGRKKENEIIRQFNTANTEKWCKDIQKYYDACIPYYNELAELSQEIDAAFADKNDLEYGILKQRLANEFMQLTMLLNTIVEGAYTVPLVSTVVEQQNVMQ